MRAMTLPPGPRARSLSLCSSHFVAASWSGLSLGSGWRRFNSDSSRAKWSAYAGFHGGSLANRALLEASSCLICARWRLILVSFVLLLSVRANQLESVASLFPRRMQAERKLGHCLIRRRAFQPHANHLELGVGGSGQWNPTLARDLNQRPRHRHRRQGERDQRADPRRCTQDQRQYATIIRQICECDAQFASTFG